MVSILATGLLIAAFDIGGYFAAKESWDETAADFAVEHIDDVSPGIAEDNLRPRPLQGLDQRLCARSHPPTDHLISTCRTSPTS